MMTKDRVSKALSLIQYIKTLETDRARLHAENAKLREALGACLEVWERNHLENHVPGGRYIDDIVRTALAPAERATGDGASECSCGRQFDEGEDLRHHMAECDGHGSAAESFDQESTSGVF